MADEVTLGELSRRIDRIETRFDRFEETLTRQIAALQFVSHDAFNALVDRVEDVEESKKWLVRTLALAFLMAVLAPIIVALIVAK